MNVICLMNQKGGVGKTTTAVSLAHCYARRGQRVLLFDNDSQGNAAQALGLSGSDAMTRMYQAEDESLSSFVEEARENLDIVQSDMSLAGAAADAQDSQVLARYAGEIEATYDILIIDNPPSLDNRSIAALSLARRLERRGNASGVVVPVEPSHFALKGLVDLSQTVRNLASKESASNIQAFIPTMVDFRTGIASDTIDALTHNFGKRVTSPIRRNVRLRTAPGERQTIFEHAPDAPGAHDYEKVADETLALLNDNDADDNQ